MGEHCDISELLGDGTCPVCAQDPSARIRLDGWDELRAAVRAPEPEPLVLRIG